MKECYDLHCHSTASDGALSPAALIERAQRQGVSRLALTDHDTTAGLAEARTTAVAANITLIPGIELSANWENRCFHIVGLNINANHRPLAEGCRRIQTIRSERAERIARKLEQKRIPDALNAVKKAAGDGMITRTHFADFLLSQHHVSTQQEAFDRYLGKGKAAYVSTRWAGLEEAVSWITGADGIAVLAHPMRYDLTAAWMKRLLSAFKEAGGRGIEVVYGQNQPEHIRLSADYAQRFELAGSVGSDFHTPANPWIELGRLSPLPSGITPVWELFDPSRLQAN